MNLRALLILLATVIWFLLGGFFKWVCNDCSNQSQTNTTVASDLVPKGVMGMLPLSFGWSSDTPGAEGEFLNFLKAKAG